MSPELLREAGRAQTDVAQFVAGMATDQSLATAEAGVQGLLGATACEYAAAMFDNAASTVNDELADHSMKLSSAADQYDRVDQE